MDQELTRLEKLVCDELVELKHECTIVQDLFDLAIENSSIQGALYIHGMMSLLINPYNSLVRRSKILGIDNLPIVVEYIEYLNKTISTLHKKTKAQFEYSKEITNGI